ncbi:MAG: enoyl-CoA hydratase-related protein, partial [Pseudomonadota bacterium]
EPKVGLAALAGGLHRLPRQIGLKRAMGMMLTGRHVMADEGKELGFVNEVVPQSELMEAAMRWASMIAECSPASVRTTKEVAMKGLDTASFEEAFSQRYNAIGKMLKGPDFIEGPRAFAEKRKPNWSGE